jgi:nucleoside-diphosphate-sugar epimerase
MNTQKRILVTGATGFIGRHLVFLLLERGYTDVHLLVRTTSDISMFDGKNVKLLYGDLSDPVSLNKIDWVFDVVYHCAGYVATDSATLLWRHNVRATENICQRAWRFGVEKFIYVSSVAVVSGSFDVPLTEDKPYAATNIYGKSKIEAEKTVRTYMFKGLQAVIVRPPIVYGEGEPHLLKLIMTLMRYRALPLLNRGAAKMHMVYVRNLAAFMVACLEDDALLGGTFFSCDEDVLSAREIFEALSRAAGLSGPVLVNEKLTACILKLPFVGKWLEISIKDRVYSGQRVKSACSFKPPYAAKAALAQTGAYYR